MGGIFGCREVVHAAHAPAPAQADAANSQDGTNLHEKLPLGDAQSLLFNALDENAASVPEDVGHSHFEPVVKRPLSTHGVILDAMAASSSVAPPAHASASEVYPSCQQIHRPGCDDDAFNLAADVAATHAEYSSWPSSFPFSCSLNRRTIRAIEVQIIREVELVIGSTAGRVYVCS